MLAGAVLGISNMAAVADDFQPALWRDMSGTTLIIRFGAPVYIDEVVVDTIRHGVVDLQEPTSLAMLAFAGGLILLWRRKCR
jgi:hypothetical protein